MPQISLSCTMRENPHVCYFSVTCLQLTPATTDNDTLASSYETAIAGGATYTRGGFDCGTQEGEDWPVDV